MIRESGESMGFALKLSFDGVTPQYVPQLEGLAPAAVAVNGQSTAHLTGADKGSVRTGTASYSLPPGYTVWAIAGISAVGLVLAAVGLAAVLSRRRR